ncbi:MAG: Glu/Leu/Phe/Val dehydrogenase [Candidatus Micrarchaeota archaeon]|nr:Glu/Leu/Phe/Val dehydrogenase [Candidatus Micrarchaeota archaeon]
MFEDAIGPEVVMNVYDPITKMQGVVVVDNTALGPGKGGIRMVPDITVEEVFGLARAMTWKNALAGIPFGGAKSGIKAHGTNHHKHELVKAFAEKIKPIVPEIYIPGPDMNMGEREMAIIANTIGTPKAATGKPADMGGLPHELGSTGFGVALATEVALEHARIPIEGATVAIEGFGNVGTFTMKFLTEKGAKVIAVSDSKGTAYLESGLDYQRLMQVKKEKGSVIAYPGATVLEASQLFSLKCDVLIPGARPNVIHVGNAHHVKARIIVEAANIPMKPEVEHELAKKGILIIPDFVANAGGVISSYVEYIGGSEKEMFAMVRDKITSNTRLVIERARGGNLREAALEIAEERVIEAMEKKCNCKLKR